MKKYIICDLDGTLCNHDHRLYLAWSNEWNEYNDGCVTDPVNNIVRDFLAYNLFKNRDMSIIFLTERTENFYFETSAWLSAFFDLERENHILIMRKVGDYAPAPEFKKAAFLNYASETHISVDQIYCAIDDDERCVEMFKALGIKKVIHYK